MRKFFTLTGSILFCSLFFSSCLKDKCTRTYTLFQPVYKTTEEVRANIKSTSARSLDHPGKLFIRGNYIFLNDMDKGIHIIDNSNPSAPKSVSFIEIPGNIDLAVKGNTLYADAYTDMVTLDITDPLKVVIKKFTDNAFPYRRYSNGFVADTSKVIVDWIRKDTLITIDCDNQGFWFGCPACSFAVESTGGFDKSVSPFGSGVGGSMARFALQNNSLYAVTISDLNVFDITVPTDPHFTKKIGIGWNIETIFPFQDKLFIGSRNGMFIYNTTDPTTPAKVGQFSHIASCDPVIADNQYAYVTLRSGTACQGFTNQMEVLNISNLVSPYLVKTYPMTNPHGLSKDGNILFLADGTDGLKIFDASNPTDIKLMKHIRNIETFDVIAFNKRAIVVGKDGLLQFDYSDINDIKLLSKIGY